MTPDDSGQIIRQLATLTESVAGMRREFTDRLNRQDQASEIERQDSHASRRDLHEKVNGVAEDVATVKGDVKVAGMVAAQARDMAADVKAAVEKAAPTISDMENAKKFGAWIVGGGAAALIGTGLAVLAWGESFKVWFAHWLGIIK